MSLNVSLFGGPTLIAPGSSGGATDSLLNNLLNSSSLTSPGGYSYGTLNLLGSNYGYGNSNTSTTTITPNRVKRAPQTRST